MCVRERIRSAKAVLKNFEITPEAQKEMREDIADWKNEEWSQPEEGIPYWWWNPTGEAGDDIGVYDDVHLPCERPQAVIDRLWMASTSCLLVDDYGDNEQNWREKGIKFLERELGGPLFPDGGFAAFYDSLLDEDPNADFSGIDDFDPALIAGE